MKIFYIDIEETKKKISKTELNKYADIELKSEKRFFEYTLGRFLVKNVAKNIYNIDDEIILNQSGKPQFKNNGIYFSISHTKGLVAVCFDETPCGIDIEFMKERNLKEVSKYYGIKFDNIEKFYKFWTKQEAVYKLNDDVKDFYSEKFLDKYYLTVVSGKKFSHKIITKKLIIL
ncbi:hypothetical protein IJS77_04065 [bacterium]|nr:hypothetical protein [bacterium]